MEYMQQALSLASLALGQTSPNPAVGAVLVKHGKVVGTGFTQPPGGKHAEIMAIEDAGAQAAGSTLYVTLEPCCHFGRTPPCTQAVIQAGILEVHAAVQDPNPLVAGKGMAELEAAGISTHMGEEETAARELNEAFFKYIVHHIPFVTVKFAMSLDGKIATSNGDSRWISCEDSRQFAHHLRYTNDAIMVGVNTVIADDPKLTARCSGGRGGTARQQPLRVVVDGHVRTPVSSRLFGEQGQTLIAVGRNLDAAEIKAFASVNAEVTVIPSDNGVIDLRLLLEELGRRQITSVLVEGGGTLIGSFFDQKLVDKVVAFISPIIIGGEGKNAVGGKGAEMLADACRLERVNTLSCGADTVITGYVPASHI
jgi:diaminohydroxyphosphoribosylaminopyrimidine deaminase/5-amino-6-(5-phosphoribosylamino)uracil reductase